MEGCGIENPPQLSNSVLVVVGVVDTTMGTGMTVYEWWRFRITKHEVGKRRYSRAEDIQLNPPQSQEWDGYACWDGEEESCHLLLSVEMIVYRTGSDLILSNRFLRRFYDISCEMSSRRWLI